MPLIRSPLTSVPIGHLLNLSGGGSNTEIASNYIAPQFQGMVGNSTAHTIPRCVVPDISEFRGEWLRVSKIR